MPTMRLYHFLRADYALDDLRRSRLKISTFDDLNDPYELWAAAQTSPDLRRRLRGFKEEMASKHGLLCFSTNWHQPLLWSHYGDRHRGMALGFDLGVNTARQVDYVDERPGLETVDWDAAQMLLFAKYRGWEYEQEWRVYTRLSDRDPAKNLFFAEFNDGLMLREVVVGPLCDVNRVAIEEALGAARNNVCITKARLAFNSFRVVRDQRGLRRRRGAS